MAHIQSVLRNPDEGASEASLDRVRLHCGHSLNVFAVMPFGGDLACAEEPGTLEVGIEVEALGVGRGNTTVEVHYDAEEYCVG